jgi:hypothetical protein
LHLHLAAVVAVLEITQLQQTAALAVVEQVGHPTQREQAQQAAITDLLELTLLAILKAAVVVEQVQQAAHHQHQ